MALGDITVTVVGNLTDDPELRFTPSGQAVVAFTVAVNPRTYDRDANEWRDGEASYMRCQGWRQLAENAAESLHKGDRVIVTGRVREERWEDKETHQARSAWRLTADAIGPDLSWATATIKRARRSADQVAPDDPWTTASKNRPAGVAGTQEPPF